MPVCSQMRQQVLDVEAPEGNDGPDGIANQIIHSVKIKTGMDQAVVDRTLCVLASKNICYLVWIKTGSPDDRSQVTTLSNKIFAQFFMLRVRSGGASCFASHPGNPHGG